MLVTGGEDCIVRAWDTRSGKQAWSVTNAHTNRIKGVAILESRSDTDEHSSGSPVIVASASSDGLLKIWDTRMVGSEDRSAPVPLMQAETKARLTCLASSSGFMSKFSILLTAYKCTCESIGVNHRDFLQIQGFTKGFTKRLDAYMSNAYVPFAHKHCLCPILLRCN